LLELGLAAGTAGIAGTLPSVLAPASARAATPRAGGVLKMAYASSPRTIDPALAVQADEYMITQGIYDNLARTDEKLQAQPQLALRWSPDDQARVWTFTLRQGVKFHHGRELTAQDVVFTFERILDPKTGSPGRTAMGPIEKVEAVDAYTVRFRLSIPYADLPLGIGSTFGRILPHDRAGRIATDPSGTGPFRLVEFKPGESTRMVRFPDYWDKPRPYLDELWQVNIPQAATLIASLSGGAVQMLWEAPVTYLPVLGRAAGVSLVEVKSPAFQPVSMLANQKPFDDNRVRLAMKHLVDRAAVVKAVWQGHATVASDHPVPEINPFWSALPPRPYDVAKAKALLAEAGHAGGLNLELWTSSERAGMPELAVAVQQMVAPAGVKVEIKTVPWTVFNANVWKKKAFYVNNWGGRATIDETLFPYFRTGGSWNEGEFSIPALDKLLDEGRSQTDERKRKDAYAQAQRLIADEAYMMIAYHSNYVTAMRSNVKGYIVNPLKNYVEHRWTYLDA
jgi:peptide/nickel transport system substrate-binding protein